MEVIDFQLDQAVLESDRRCDPLSADVAALVWTFFTMPVRINIKDADMLQSVPILSRGDVWIAESAPAEIRKAQAEIVSSPWLPIPLLHLAMEGTNIVRRLNVGETIAYDIPGGGESLTFHRIAAQTDVSSSLNGRSATIKHNELRWAFEAFAHRVRQILITEIPGLEQRQDLWRDYPL